MRRNLDNRLLTYMWLPLWLMAFSGLGLSPSLAEGTPPVKASSPKDATLDNYLRDCGGKPSGPANCEKLRKDTIDILKQDVHTLGSTASRTYLPEIIGMFSSDEPDLRIAAADALGMIGPQDQDVDALIPITNDPVPDVRQAVSQMIGHGKGNALALLKQRIILMSVGRTPQTPADASKYSMPVAPDSSYWFDSSDATVGRLSYVSISGKSDPAQFFRGKAKKGPFPLAEFKDKYRYQLQDENEANSLAQQAAGKELENVQPPDPTNMQAFTEYMQKVQSIGAKQGSRIYLDSYDPKLFGSPTVYVLEERQIGRRSYPTRFVVLYQEQALRKPGYRLSWMTVADRTIKEVQEASLQEEQQEEGRKKESAALKKKAEELESLAKKKDAVEQKQFKKGQDDLEKALGF
ncbi:hypothetical protein W02_17280 [Nitrospira sp. KM1]|uniref:HEAT repeat domain-containing protein n=1 Tax=Nitrospira sp. KM1 TaxID=1936990 RepID=UPI0013A72DDE|nr:HEAT repeat domain-containing protein [Nitrospira sp. KM1]BCA54588.1 hypothetical protein W02_17280 [Nitrospira sp. KM1]